MKKNNYLSASSNDEQPNVRHVAKQRRCLMCLNTFRSISNGRRICRVCKRKGVWHSGGNDFSINYDVQN